MTKKKTNIVINLQNQCNQRKKAKHNVNPRLRRGAPGVGGLKAKRELIFKVLLCLWASLCDIIKNQKNKNSASVWQIWMYIWRDTYRGRLLFLTSCVHWACMLLTQLSAIVIRLFSHMHIAHIQYHLCFCPFRASADISRWEDSYWVV